ncbi:MAG TPA: hypothetical protein VFC74_00280 [Oscillospiraceae bacterium]|nr:hypothetical protein [Oscillospiraceae bacterium]
MARFELKAEDLKRLEEKIGRLQEQAEEEINKILHTETVRDVSNSIQQLINVSKKKKGTHAKHGKPFKTEPFNLGFFIRNYPSYGYLVFPDEGRGIRNQIKQDFTGRGIERERPRVVDRLLEVLTKRIEEEL